MVLLDEKVSAHDRGSLGSLLTLSSPNSRHLPVPGTCPQHGQPVREPPPRSGPHPRRPRRCKMMVSRLLRAQSSRSSRGIVTMCDDDQMPSSFVNWLRLCGQPRRSILKARFPDWHRKVKPKGERRRFSLEGVCRGKDLLGRGFGSLGRPESLAELIRRPLRRLGLPTGRRPLGGLR